MKYFFNNIYNIVLFNILIITYFGLGQDFVILNTSEAFEIGILDSVLEEVSELESKLAAYGKHILITPQKVEEDEEEDEDVQEGRCLLYNVSCSWDLNSSIFCTQLNCIR